MKKIVLSGLISLFGWMTAFSQQTMTGFVYDFASTTTGTNNCLISCCASNIGAIVRNTGDGVGPSNLSITTVDGSLQILSNATTGGAGSQKANGYSQNPLLIDLYRAVGSGPSATCSKLQDASTATGGNVVMTNFKKVRIIAKASDTMRLRFELGNAFLTATNVTEAQIFEMKLTNTYQAFVFDYNGLFGSFDSTKVNVIRFKFNVGTAGGVNTGFTGSINIKRIEIGSAVTTATGATTTAGLFFNEDNYSQLVSVYPNPATENITVDMTSLPGANTVKLVNAQGAVLSEQNAIGYANFNLQGLTKGLYIVQIFSDNKVVRKKVMVE